jgi:hypothetical protein
MEVRGCTAAGEEAAIHFLKPVGGFCVSVIGLIGAGFYLFQFIRGGGVEEVADAFLTPMFDGIGGYIVGRMYTPPQKSGHALC